MKRRLALLMAFVLIVYASASAFATESGTFSSSQAGQESTESGGLSEQGSEAQAEGQESGAQDGTEGTGGQESGSPDGAEGNGNQESVTPDGAEGNDGQESGSPDGTEGNGGQESGSPDGAEGNGGQESGSPDGAEGNGSQEPGTPDGTEGTEGQEPDSQPADREGSGESQETPESEEGGQDISQARDVCQVDVSIGAALILQKPVVFYITLTDSEGGKKEGTITLNGDDGNGSEESVVRFRSLKEGKYVLRVSAEGFAAYTQEISVKSKETVRLMTGFLAGMNYAQGAAHPGVLLIGDVNKDGAINEADRAALMDAIEGGDATGLAADLNGDGQIDIADLEYFAKGYQESRDILAKIESSVPAAAILPREGTGTRVEGSLSALLEDGTEVSLVTQNGEPISSSNPVELTFDFLEAGEAGLADGILIETGEDTSVTSAFINISYTDKDGKAGETGPIPMNAGIHYLLEDSDVRAEIDEDGNIQVHLGSQVALKTVTLTITGTEDSSNLAEISTVEFINGMEDRIPEPEMDIPENLTASAGSSKISLAWDSCKNITGYEVEVTHVESGLVETIIVPKNALDVTSFGGKELVNYQEYRIRVQSVNGTWRSGYGEAVSAVPKPSGKPDKPDNVSAVGKYQSIVVSWKQMKDTVSYNLYYRKSSESEYQKVTGITVNSYTLTGLEDLTEYTIYVTGVNELGESNPSLTVAAITTDLNPAVIPKYGMINIGEKGEVGAHIISATMNGKMEASPLDVQQGTAWGAVDLDPTSYYSKSTWDDGGYNFMNLNHGLTFEFDQAYKMDTFAFHDVTSADTGLFYVQVRYWDENGTATYYTYGKVALQAKRDEANRLYYVVKLPEPVNAKKIQFGLARYAAQGNLITVSDVYFYYFDTLTEDIMNLYEDDLHTTLRPEVTQADIDALRIRINTIDEISGEYHPDRELLELELQTAEAILRDTALNPAVEIHGGISTRDEDRGFSGLNAWQPLGVVAAAQEEIVVYVGHNSKKTGESTNLQLVATQYHSESNAVSTVVGTLKVGANKITVPKLGSTTGMESGGALYVQYTGTGGDNDRYAVRVSGGVQVPRLDLYQVTDSAERLERAKAYVEALEAFVGQMEELHEKVHLNSENKQVAYAYDQTNCILGASDIMLDTMMISLPAKQLLAGTGNGTVEERACRLLDSMQAMEDMMYLFYQHKGLNASAPDAKDRIPKGHLNIRYQRMFAGAFMYASGNHIGIEWGSASGLTGVVPVQADSEGRYVSGSYFGWGIAHEIGHCINQGTYAVAEITNNYYSVLAQARDDNGTVRFQYDNVYAKVTSGAKGASSNVFTQLGMYWQLHLAYDKGYNYKTYEDYDEQLANLFFARVDTYARNTAKAPQPDGVALKLAGDKDQNLMRLSCAAAEKNLLEFFERWGMTPNEETISYATQFEKETRAIYYVNDDARVYSLQGGTSSLGVNGTVEAVGDVVARVNGQDANRVDFILSNTGIPEEDVLGYEITRCMISGGVTVRETAGFTTGTIFSDWVYANNRMVWYEITVIDKYLNRSAVKSLDPIKIEYDGSLEKTFWSISTENLTAPETSVAPGTEEDPCAPEAESPAGLMIDGDPDTVYTATAAGTAEILIEFNKTLTVAGFKYRVGSGTKGNYVVQVLEDGIWVDAAAGSFAADGADTIYFENPDGKYVSTYSVTALKLVLSGSGEISVAELDVLGVTGDNVDFRRAGDGTAAIGKLAEDYQYGSNPGDVIPAGSIVFTGSYKGSPAYNAVLLYDQDGHIVGGVDAEGNLKARQIILADVPAEGNIQNVSDGTWIYWIEAGWETDLSKIQKVRAELYRVNNALTNEGQRLVSDSLFEAIPQTLPEIRFSGGSIPQQ